MSSSLNEREADLLVAIQKQLFDVPGVVPAARGLSHFGEHALGWMAIAAVGSVVETSRKRPARRRQWIAMGGAAFTSHAISVVLKRIVRRRRPHDERIQVGVATPSKLSFPSSHATSTSAALTSMSDIWGTPVPLAGIPVMMASRMVLGVHYPTDTLIGAIIGITTSKVATRIERHSA